MLSAGKRDEDEDGDGEPDPSLSRNEKEFDKEKTVNRIERKDVWGIVGRGATAVCSLAV